MPGERQERRREVRRCPVDAPCQQSEREMEREEGKRRHVSKHECHNMISVRTQSSDGDKQRKGGREREIGLGDDNVTVKE